MKRASLIIAVSIVLAANALALFHAARNRAGNPEAEMTLTNRELRYFDQSAIDDDSGVTLHLQWTDPNILSNPELEDRPNWFDRQKLQALGFDCGVDPGSPDAARLYQRQRPRQAFVALDYDGAAWHQLLQEHEEALAKRRVTPEPDDSAGFSAVMSHLVAIDADLDPVKLRARHPDRRTVLILPAVVAVTLDRLTYYGVKSASERPPRISGRIQELPSSIHVPRPFSDEFRRPDQSQRKLFNNYTVSLRYGSSLEPWVTGVQITDPQ
ncbi:MAG: DUF4824 family protein [Bryobacteraceae bacterium]|jgi:hypothetical protein